MTADAFFHSSVRIIAQNATLWVDPYGVPATHDANIVLLTHAHYDHTSPACIKGVLAKGGVIICPQCAISAVDGIAPVTVIGQNGCVELLGVTVHSFPAYNIGKPYHKKGDGVGYVIACDGQRVLVAGDTDVTPELCAQRCDKAFLPVGGTYTMDANEAARAARLIGAQENVPTHFASISGVAGPEAGRLFLSLLSAKQ